MVFRLVVAVLHYMFRPTWPSSGVYDVSLLYSWRNLLRCFCCHFLHVVILCTFSFVFFCCVFVSFLILVCVFCFLPFLVVCVEQRQLNVRPSTIKLHADGNITSKLIELCYKPECRGFETRWGYTQQKLGDLHSEVLEHPAYWLGPFRLLPLS
jgi:hypothetical protein